MSLLTQLPAEIVHNILIFCDPVDLFVVPKTCRFLYTCIKNNKALHREIYYRELDAPPTADLDWVQEIHDLVRLQTICSRHEADRRDELDFVHTTVTRLLRNASQPGPDEADRAVRSVTYPASRNATVLKALFADDANREAFLCRSFLFDRVRGGTMAVADRAGGGDDAGVNEDHQKSAKLHSLYGAPVLKHGRTRASSTYPFACSKVYDLREYTEESRWGPFLADGSERVDWEKIEAILIVLRANVKSKGLDTFPIFSNFWNAPFAGSWSGSYLPWPANRERKHLELRDPYDVSGTWLRVVCFLDYNDFFKFNFPLGDALPDNMPRPALSAGEAIRLILIKIHVTEIEQEEGQQHPIVHFKGFSRSLDGSWDENGNSDLRGMAQMTPEGELRWTTFSIFGGEDRWKSEGIQIGGPRSARGVVGNWFDVDYDPHGPCGPTAFWKISDRVPHGGNDQDAMLHDQEILLHDFLPIVDGYEVEVDDGYLPGHLHLS
ncbi:hypothetical protein QBC39DRAFT_89137 [Podospora conica]|nr:hypothetical protein QBC39DRAFT_89137 [Schizothecium conicum]